MTYARFHLLFNIPLLALLVFQGFLAPFQAAEWRALAGVMAVVFVFASLWDNAAVARGLWDFPKDRFTFRIVHPPVEEYLFFIFQPLLIILGTRFFFVIYPNMKSGLETPLGLWHRIALVSILGVWGAAGWLLKRHPLRARFNYVRHLFFWFLPVVAIQWAVAPGLLFTLLPALTVITVVFGSYYVLADWIAVRTGLWYFDEKQIMGWKFGGVLPWEESAFFYLTTLLVAQNYLILLPPGFR